MKRKWAKDISIRISRQRHCVSYPFNKWRARAPIPAIPREDLRRHPRQIVFGVFAGSRGAATQLQQLSLKLFKRKAPRFLNVFSWRC